MKNKTFRYIVYVGHLPILKTNDRERAYDLKDWLNTRRPKAPVRVHNNTSTI